MIQYIVGSFHQRKNELINKNKSIKQFSFGYDVFFHSSDLPLIFNVLFYILNLYYMYFYIDRRHR